MPPETIPDTSRPRRAHISRSPLPTSVPNSRIVSGSPPAAGPPGAAAPRRSCRASRASVLESGRVLARGGALVNEPDEDLFEVWPGLADRQQRDAGFAELAEEPLQAV